MKLSQSLRRQLGDMILLHIEIKYGTQTEAARAWGVTPPFVSKVCSGQRTPTDQMMKDARIELVARYRPQSPGSKRA